MEHEIITQADVDSIKVGDTFPRIEDAFTTEWIPWQLEVFIDCKIEKIGSRFIQFSFRIGPEPWEMSYWLADKIRIGIDRGVKIFRTYDPLANIREKDSPMILPPYGFNRICVVPHIEPPTLELPSQHELEDWRPRETGWDDLQGDDPEGE